MTKFVPGHNPNRPKTVNVKGVPPMTANINLMLGAVNGAGSATSPTGNGGKNAGGGVHIHPVVERVEHTETIFVIVEERETSPWKAILASVGALAGILILTMASIWAVLALVDHYDKKSNGPGPEVLALTAENAALKQKFDDYVGHCEDGTAPGGVDRLRVINNHNPGGPADPGLVYAGCITSENILGGRITSP